MLLVSPGWAQTDMGGASAPDPLEPVVRGLRRVVGEATLAQTGAFFDWRGQPVAW